MSQILIEGSWRPAHSGAEQLVHNPATLEPAAAAPYCDPQDVVAAMAAARRALESWRMSSREARRAHLVELGRALSACAPVLAQLQALESGQAYRECLESALVAARCFTQLSDPEASAAGEPRESADPRAIARTLLLAPDYPLVHWACCAAPMLEGGSTLVCVAPRQAPLAVLRAARCASALPAGVLNVVVASPQVVTAALGEAWLHEPVAALAGGVADSGSDAVFIGKTLEGPVTLAGAASLRLFHSGQRPGQSARIYVEQRRSHELADQLHEYLAFLECGDPCKAATDLGPLCSSAALQRVEDQVGRALRAGALLKLGGRRYQPWGLCGYFFQPTLMIEGREAERAPDGEIRGPVLIISPVRNLADALRQERAQRISFFGHDLDAQLRSLTAAGIEFQVADATTPIERLLHGFRAGLRGPVRIELVTAPHGSWFPYRDRMAPA